MEKNDSDNQPNHYTIKGLLLFNGIIHNGKEKQNSQPYPYNSSFGNTNKAASITNPYLEDVLVMKTHRIYTHL